ncbi:hypothetical protein E2320_012577, partial [Naja naja]
MRFWFRELLDRFKTPFCSQTLCWDSEHLWWRLPEAMNIDGPVEKTKVILGSEHLIGFCCGFASLEIPSSVTKLGVSQEAVQRKKPTSRLCLCRALLALATHNRQRSIRFEDEFILLQADLRRRAQFCEGVFQCPSNLQKQKKPELRYKLETTPESFFFSLLEGKQTSEECRD